MRPFHRGHEFRDKRGRMLEAGVHDDDPVGARAPHPLDDGAAEAAGGRLTVDEGVRGELKGSETGQAGLAEVDRLLRLTEDTIPAERIAFTPNLVRGLDYYTGIIFEVVAPGDARLAPSS